MSPWSEPYPLRKQDVYPGPAKTAWALAAEQPKSGWKVGCRDPNAVGMKGPVAKRLRLAELLLGQLDGAILAGGVDLERALADLALPAILAEHVLHEVNDITRHGSSLQTVRETHVTFPVTKVLMNIKPPAQIFET
jgi:hypothetical protein